MSTKSHTVRLIHHEGNVDIVKVSFGQTILEAAISSGCAVSSECTWGSCASCTGHLISGQIIHTSPPRVLRKEHLNIGYVLLCVAEPLSDCSIELGTRFKESLSDITRNSQISKPGPKKSESRGWQSQKNSNMGTQKNL